MYKKVRGYLLQRIWDGYIGAIPNFSKLMKGGKPVLDHFAIIDLPSQHSGKESLAKIFERIGYTKRGEGYLPSKQNGFLWMLEADYADKEPQDVLPQIVLADFKLEELSDGVRQIVAKYINDIKGFDYECFAKLTRELEAGEAEAEIKIADMIYDYINMRQWELPTLSDYNAVKAENELLAWVLLMGRKVNHFGVLVNSCDSYQNLEEFNKFVTESGLAKLNQEGGQIKGGQKQGIAQSSTVGELIKHEVADGEVEVHDSFVEFIWRYPNCENPKLWTDYYTEFVANNANFVIESVYKKAV